MKGNLIIKAENMQAFESSIDRLDNSLRELRRVVHNLVPEALVRYGLDTALRDLCTGITESRVLEVTYQSSGLEEQQIEPTTAHSLFLITRDLINNIIRYAAAHSAIVQLHRTDGHLSLTVKDDGRALEPQSPGLPQETGWQQIRNSVELLKGKIDIQSTPGRGNSVMIVVNN